MGLLDFIIAPEVVDIHVGFKFRKMLDVRRFQVGRVKGMGRQLVVPVTATYATGVGSSYIVLEQQQACLLFSSRFIVIASLCCNFDH